MGVIPGEFAQVHPSIGCSLQASRIRGLRDGGFLRLAISSKCRDYHAEVEKTLKEVGKMKYHRPLYTALVQGIGNAEEKILAKR
ncbi:Peptidase M1, leukotriene A4 hydrolase/aminopeptidase C-terminal, partial [Dillenia turbinata]